jgi:hypothetical protein
MAARGGQDQRTKKVVVGLLADPGLPADMARDLAAELPEVLKERVDDRVEWSVRVVTEDLTTGDQRGDRMIDRADERRRREGWDYAICLTDLPWRSGRRPLVADVSSAHRVAVLSVPALAGIFPEAQARELLIGLIAQLAGAQSADGGTEQFAGKITRLVTPLRPVPRPEEDIDLRLTTPRTAGRLRLLIGMVRVNRPWLLALGLSKALATALAAGAIASLNGIVWQLAARLGQDRLSLATILSVGAMVTWLIVNHRLWQRVSVGSRRYRERVMLSNAATVLTLVIGVMCLCAALFVFDFLAQSLVISSQVFEDNVKRPVGPSDYLKLAWLVSSIATVGGALGSGLESHSAVRTATYGVRQRSRVPKQQHGPAS